MQHLAKDHNFQAISGKLIQVEKSQPRTAQQPQSFLFLTSKVILLRAKTQGYWNNKEPKVP